MRRGLIASIACAAISVGLCAPARAQVNGDWHTVGSAVLQGGQLILTPDVPDLAGAAWRTPAIRLRNRVQASFGYVRSDAPAASDGYAFVLQGDSVDSLGGAGGGLGYTGIPDSVAVEFDTWQNIAADFGSPTSVDDPAAPHISVHT